MGYKVFGIRVENMLGSHHLLQARKLGYCLKCKIQAKCAHLEQNFHVLLPPDPTVISERYHIGNTCLGITEHIEAQIKSLKI